MTNHPIPEPDLHAYIDGELPPDRAADIARLLQEQPETAERVGIYLAQRDALRSGLASIAGEPLPPGLDLQAMVAARLGERRVRWRAAAAVLLAFLVGGAGGWALHDRLLGPPSDLTMLAREAIANHVVYAADRRRPTELGAQQRQDLARWVSNRLKHTVAPPDMGSTGFHYMGGRLAATPQGPAGLFMYQDESGQRMSVFVLPMPDAADTAAHMVRVEGIEGCVWIDKGVGYTVVAPVSPAELHSLAEHVRQQFDSQT
ncbi:MAG TPA: anti-sigma factor [Acetobacteraceae bacterium]|nr:anti-sigma factor [Acetobacteraceae bacterium]